MYTVWRRYVHRDIKPSNCCVGLRDPATGDLYEALSDQEVYFLGEFKAKHSLPFFNSGLGNCTETGHDFCCG